MPRSVLLDPNNRLLGGATTDFGLFGSQPATHVTVVAPVTDTAIDDFRPDRVSSDTDVHSDTADAIGEIGRDSAAEAGSSDTIPTAPAPGAPPQGAPAAPAVHAVSEGVPHALGSSGTFVPQPQQIAHLIADDGAATHAADASAVAPIDGSATSAPAFAATALQDAPTLGNDAVAHLAGGGDQLLGVAAGALDGAHTTIHSALDDAHATVDTALDTLGGADPAAGISTLLGLVESNEMAVVGPATDVGHGEPAASILDTLTADVPIGDTLLGDHGLSDHVADVGGAASVLDHHDGLGGL